MNRYIEELDKEDKIYRGEFILFLIMQQLVVEWMRERGRMSPSLALAMRTAQRYYDEVRDELEQTI
jgi:hypothetical protein